MKSINFLGGVGWLLPIVKDNAQRLANQLSELPTWPGVAEARLWLLSPYLIYQKSGPVTELLNP